MANLIIILGILFGALFVLVILLERFGSGAPDPKLQKLGRYILPLCGLLVLIQLIRYLFFK